MARTVKGKVTVKVAKPSASVTAKVTKTRARNAKRGVKQHYATPKALAFIATCEAVSGGKLIAPALRIATKGNATERRQWCVDNGAVTVSILDVQETDGTPERPENALRARIRSLGTAGIIRNGSVGYVRALDTATARRNPSHPLAMSVYLYRTK